MNTQVSPTVWAVAAAVAVAGALTSRPVRPSTPAAHAAHAAHAADIEEDRAPGALFQQPSMGTRGVSADAEGMPHARFRKPATDGKH